MGMDMPWEHNDQKRWEDEVLKALKDHTFLLTQILSTLKAIQVATQKKAVGIQLYFRSPETGVAYMALSLPVGQTDKYFVNAVDSLGDPGATLASGQTIAVVSADPSVVLTPDATPGVDPKTNIQSAASGSVAIGGTPVLGTAVTVTATLTAADGTTVLDTETDTVTPLVGTATKIGILFEDSSLNPGPAGAKKSFKR